MLRLLIAAPLLLLGGCSLLPEMAHEPMLHNPFPQLSTVAVAPFFNMSEEPTLNTREVALAYFTELQSIPGFEVIPVASVEEAINRHGIRLNSPEEVRRLAQILGADAVVIGAVTEYSPYYPPRLAMQVRWYSANPGFHPIPPGYGLPWGTPAEEQIPAPLVFEAEMALAREQLATQTPPMPQAAQPAHASAVQHGQANRRSERPAEPSNEPSEMAESPLGIGDSPEWRQFMEQNGVTPPSRQRPTADAQQEVEQSAAERETSDTRAVEGEDFPASVDHFEGLAGSGFPGDGSAEALGFPPDWPDPRGFIPPPPQPHPSGCRPTNKPVLQHTQVYVGNDSDLTAALATYHHFRDDARLGGWQSYLQRSGDFIRFCCHMHIAEMLTARGGAGETRVVWRWPVVR